MKTLLSLAAAVPLVAAGVERVPAGLELDSRLQITLWAAEPDVVDPVAIAWDEHRRAYVAECRDYPYGAGPGGAVGSTVRLLEDADGDGRIDRSTVFARGLSYVTGIAVWRGGVLVTAAPDLLYLRDTDHDGVADEREVVLTGFALGVSDSLVNGLRFGLDGRIHGANGGNGGSLTSPRRPGEVLALGDDDFVVDPGTGRVERTGQSGGGFGLVFDDFGRAFTTYNIDHLQHRFLSRRQAARFPGFPPVRLTRSISDHGEMARIFPISTAQTRPNHPEQAGHFSAAGGMGRVASGLFPDELRDSVFVCDVVGNLVHRDVISPAGPVFRAARAGGEQGPEFLAGRDPVFRPVGLETGPDGALYLLDMQRDVIEHPDYIPAKVRERLDLRAGQDRGRIYRIAPRGTARIRMPDLTAGGDANLVSALSDDNQWVRTTAQRLLLERRSTAAVAALRRQVMTGARALGRLHALWTLEGLGGLRNAEILRGLSDTHPGVRENALWLADPRVGHDPALAGAVLGLLPDPQARVRFVAAQVAGSVTDTAAAIALAALWRMDQAHDWTRLAVLSSVRPEHGRTFAQRALAVSQDGPAPVSEPGVRELADLLGARAGEHPETVSALVELADGLPAPVRRALWEGLAAGMERAGVRPTLTAVAERRLTERFPAADRGELRTLWLLARALGLPENVHQAEALLLARSRAADPARSSTSRVDEIRLLGLGSSADLPALLLKLMDARQPSEVQEAAFEELRGLQDPAVGAGLVAVWRTLGPGLRSRALSLLLERRSFHEPLVRALEEGVLTVGELNPDLEQRRRLLRGGAPDIRARAAKFMSDEEYSNRRAIVDEWLAKLPADGDAGRGQQAFGRLCAGCHRSGTIGQRVGPDLTAVAHRSVEDLLSNILDPNMALNPGFVAYTAETADGEVQTGLLAGQTPESIVLLQAGGVRVTLPRNRVAKLEAEGRSLMPEGLESGLTPQELRDLIAFLQAPR